MASLEPKIKEDAFLWVGGRELRAASCRRTKSDGTPIDIAKLKRTAQEFVEDQKRPLSIDTVERAVVSTHGGITRFIGGKMAPSAKLTLKPFTRSRGRGACLFLVLKGIVDSNGQCAGTMPDSSILDREAMYMMAFRRYETFLRGVQHTELPAASPSNPAMKSYTGPLQLLEYALITDAGAIARFPIPK